MPRLLPLLALIAASTAHAHVTLEYPVGQGGASYKATFRVGHGCGESPTRRIVVDIPAGVLSTKPMPKPGWTLEVERAPLPQPVANHGRAVTEDVVRVSWTAKTRDDMLPNAHYDEFVLQAQLPAKGGRLWWPVRQVCAEGHMDWTQVPSPGQKAADLKSPAALLEVLPAAGGAGGHHH